YSNWVISTVPSGNLAVIFGSPPRGLDEIVERAYVHIRAALDLHRRIPLLEKREKWGTLETQTEQLSQR
ncbi:MAG: hypothetical protein WBD25_01490, partial [Terriglobales bacterium]